MNDTENPHHTIGWIAVETDGPSWNLYLKTATGSYRLDGIEFPDRERARTWATQHMGQIPEIQ